MARLLGKLRDLACRFAKDRRGSVTVEFVASLPITVAALAFSFEFGRCLWAQQIVTKDVRDAARYLSRQQAPLATAVKDNAKNLAQTGQISGGTMHFPWTATSQVTVADPYQSFPTGFRVPVSIIEVKGTIPLTISFLSLLHINTSITLKASDQVRLIGN